MLTICSQSKGVISRKLLQCYCRNILPIVSCQPYSSGAYRDVTKQHDVIVGAKVLRQMLMQHVGAKSFWSEHMEEFKDIHKVQAKSQDDLVTRTMTDSKQEVLIPLGTDLKQREKYLTFYDTLRIGKLLEDLDTMAGWVGFKYFKGPTERAPFSLVTACVDCLTLKDDNILSTEDIKLTGFVSWAGRTSLEITINIDQTNPETKEWEREAEAVFVMVARSLKDGSPSIVNKMVTHTEEEKFYFKKGEKNNVWRRKQTDESLFKTLPTIEEFEMIHHLFLNTLDPKKSTFSRRVKPNNTIWMGDTRLKNLFICHPQSRNLYNKIFGGFLMREAFELAWANTCVHIKAKPTLLAIDDIVFRKPVEVGSLLYLSSQIVYTTDNYLLTRVNAEVVDPKSSGYVDTTNIFHFHFSSEKDFQQIVPNSYGEYILHLDGLRHAESLKTRHLNEA